MILLYTTLYITNPWVSSERTTPLSTNLVISDSHYLHPVYLYLLFSISYPSSTLLRYRPFIRHVWPVCTPAMGKSLEFRKNTSTLSLQVTLSHLSSWTGLKPPRRIRFGFSKISEHPCLLSTLLNLSLHCTKWLPISVKLNKSLF